MFSKSLSCSYSARTDMEYTNFLFWLFVVALIVLRRGTIWEYIFYPKLLLHVILNFKRIYKKESENDKTPTYPQFTFLYWDLKNILSTLTPFNIILNNIKLKVCHSYLIFILLLCFSFTLYYITLSEQATSIIFQDITALHLVVSHKWRFIFMCS